MPTSTRSHISRLWLSLASLGTTTVLGLGLGLGLGVGLGLGCATDPGSDCTPGTTNCTCLPGNSCYGGLVCLAGFCVIGSGETGGDGDPGDGDGDNPCEGGQEFCGGKCVDTQTNILHCGGCSMACASDELCHEGACATDCSEAACEGLTWCDPDTSVCLPGCEGDWQCGDAEICDIDTHECVCDFGYQLCAGVCIWEGDPCEDNCGNGVIDVGEACDGNALDGYTCQDFGFAGGTLGCLGDCSDFDQSNCSNNTCGNGQIDPGEDCDGINLGGETCVTLGFAGGALQCTNCTFNTNNCIDNSDDGNCCTPHAGLGCEVPAVSACVCQLDDFCCMTEWDAQCVTEAINDCGANCP